MKKRAEIILKGRVQKAGYRDYIDEVAFDLNLRGWVKNLEDGTVKVVCEGENKAIDEFINKIRIKEYPIRVEDVDVEYLPSTGEFKDFTIIREEDIVFATYERMDAAGRYIREINRNLGGKLDKMLGKQDSLQNTVGDGFKETKDEIHLLRDDFRQVFMTEVNELRGEIKELRQAIMRIESRMVKDEA
ncbi:MAG: acylphosphatase [Candidatus Methanoperedens sp.]|nr:acylphosphatase [Candidatus Methanoperedens sp.]